MTRFVFEKIDQLKKWISSHVTTSEKYEAYISPKNELALIPRKSTRPLKYAYAKLTPEGIKELRLLLGEKGIEIYNVANIDWDETKPPGAEFIPPK